ncbi:MAG: hypothetical protein ACI9R3_002188 [Verrucomicrobiales bacterium]|jgi:hypothetical protein
MKIEPLSLAVIVFAILQITNSARADSVVTFNELQYHPADSGQQSTPEWIELTNLMAVNVDLSGWRLRGGIDYDFPEGTVIEAGGYLVIADHPKAMPAGTLGPWSGSLNNGGEQIRLRNNSGRLMNEVDFRDSGAWPVGADGSGATLEKTLRDTASDDARNWRASAAIGGSPGATNPAAQEDSLVINEISAESAEPGEFRLELTNISAETVDLSGWRILSSTGEQFLIPGQSLNAGQFLVFTDTMLGFEPAAGDRLFLVADNGTGLADARRVTSRNRGRSPLYPGKWLFPQSPSFGAENPFVFHDQIVINEIMYHFREDPGTPAIPPVEEQIAFVPIASDWRYNESGADLGSDWAMFPHAVDNVNWKVGTALLGWETNQDGLPEPLRTSFENPLTNLIVTYYAETDFMVDGDVLGTLSRLQLRHVVDDGAVIYLNGIEIARFNLPGDEMIKSSTTANASVGSAAYSDFIEVPISHLIAGVNRLSVEVHQRSATSSDIIIGAEITGTTIVAPGISSTAIRERDEQWIELHNTSSAEVNLSGWRLNGGIDFRIPAGTSIAPHGYLVIARDSVAMKAKYPSMATRIIGDFSGRLSRSRDGIELEDASGNLTDSVAYYDGGRWPVGADGNGSSLELRDPRADNASPDAWAASAEAPKQSWETIRYRMDGSQGYGLTNWREFRIGMIRDGEVLLDEISVIRDPDGAAEELIQNGSFDTDPGDDKWRFLGNHRRTYVDEDPDKKGNRVLRLIATGSTDTRHNHLETTFADNKALRDSETYEVSFRARWISGSNQLNTRGFYQRIALTTALTRPEMSGSPGSQNSRFQANIGPTFNRLQHSPGVPAVDEEVTVTAEVDDPDSIANIELKARVDGSDEVVSYPFVVDASGHGKGTLPGQSARKVVQFWLEARDAAGAVSMAPSAGPEARALYQVQDGRGTNLPLQTMRVIMLDDDSDFMHSRYNLMSNELLGGTAIYNNTEVFYDVGVRLRGSGAGRARDGNDYRGFRVSFPSDQLFRGVHDSVGFDRSGRSPAPKRQDEIYVKHMFNKAGIPCMYDDLAYLVPPTTVHTGTAIMMMAGYGSVFTESQFEGGGNGAVFNYDITYDPSTSTGAGVEGPKPPSPFRHIGSDLRDLGDSKEAYRGIFEMRTGNRRDDYSGMIRFCKLMSLPSDELDQVIEEWMDVDEWARYAALMGLCGIGDTYILGGLQHNIRFFVSENGRGVTALPWDMDFVFSSGASSVLRPPAAGNIRKVFSIPRVERLYWGHVHDLIATTFHEDYMAPWLQHYGTVAGQTFSSQVGYIRSRRSAVSRRLPDDIPFKVTTDLGGDIEVSTPVTLIDGEGWIDIRGFRIAGEAEPLQTRWLDDSKWQVTIPLRPGTNSITLEAFDFRKRTLHTQLLNINRITNTPNPIDFLRITELNFNPSDSADAEFIELMNIGSGSLDISGVTFTDGIDFTFANGTIINGGGHILIARQRAAFEARYGNSLPLVGEYAPDALSNGGETIELRTAEGIIIQRFTFDDAWHSSTDGEGFSLVAVDPAAPVENWNEATQWVASISTGGSPGAAEPLEASTYALWLTEHFSPEEIADPAVTAPDAVINSTGIANIIKYAFALSPRDSSQPQLHPYFDTTSSSQLLSLHVRSRASDLQISIERSTDAEIWGPATTQLINAEPIDNESERVTHEITGTSNPTFIRARVSFR